MKISDLIQGRDYIVVYTNDFPISCKGTVTKNGDFYVIFINSHHSYEVQQSTLFHELEHIINGDFDKYNVNEIELQAEH